jgi:hypothetical protein
VQQVLPALAGESWSQGQVILSQAIFEGAADAHDARNGDAMNLPTNWIKRTAPPAVRRPHISDNDMMRGAIVNTQPLHN